jgi:hypothetical protein
MLALRSVWVFFGRGAVVGCCCESQTRGPAKMRIAVSPGPEFWPGLRGRRRRIRRWRMRIHGRMRNGLPWADGWRPFGIDWGFVLISAWCDRARVPPGQEKLRGSNDPAKGAEVATISDAAASFVVAVKFVVPRGRKRRTSNKRGDCGARTGGCSPQGTPAVCQAFR